MIQPVDDIPENLFTTITEDDLIYLQQTDKTRILYSLIYWDNEKKKYILDLSETDCESLTWVRRIQNNASCVSIVLVTLMHGFFGKQQYAAIALKRLTIKLSNGLCLECSTCAIFLNSSLTVSIMARFLRSSLSESGISAPFILLFNLVISCMSSTNNLSKRYPLSPIL